MRILAVAMSLACSVNALRPVKSLYEAPSANAWKCKYFLEGDGVGDGDFTISLTKDNAEDAIEEAKRNLCHAENHFGSPLVITAYPMIAKEESLHWIIVNVKAALELKLVMKDVSRFKYGETVVRIPKDADDKVAAVRAQLKDVVPKALSEAFYGKVVHIDGLEYEAKKNEVVATFEEQSSASADLEDANTIQMPKKLQAVDAKSQVPEVDAASKADSLLDIESQTYVDGQVATTRHNSEGFLFFFIFFVWNWIKNLHPQRVEPKQKDSLL